MGPMDRSQLIALLHADWTTALPMALALGLAISFLIWPLRGGRQWRRTLFSLWLAEVAFVSSLLLGHTLLAGNSIVELADHLGAQLLTATWLLLAIHAALQVLDLLLWESILSRLRDRPVPRLLINVFNVVALALAGLLVVNQVFNLPLSTLIVSSTVVSAVVGLALQDVLRSMVAGIVLQIESPMSLGDWVQVGGHEGRVTQMNWRTVTLRTRLNHHVVLTNGKVSADDIINFSRPARLQGVDAYIGVAYPHPPEQVKAVLQETVASVPGLRPTPAPRIFTTSYDDFAVTYRIRFWISDYGALRELEDAVMTRLWYGLRRAGMTIPFPIRDVNLRQVPEDAGQREAEARRARVLDALRPLPLLAPLDQAQIEQLAERARWQRFASSELLMHQGDPGNSLFVICGGQARVEVEGADGQPVTVARRGEGDILGEMSLCTGAPRTATVVAETELEAIVVDQEAFGEVLLGDPEIAGRISEILAAREMEQSARLAEDDARMPEPRSVRDEILGRIRQLFALEDEI